MPKQQGPCHSRHAMEQIGIPSEGIPKHRARGCHAQQRQAQHQNYALACKRQADARQSSWANWPREAQHATRPYHS
eukprot:12375095-Alexandrium_andersonii.AAC.1